MSNRTVVVVLVIAAALFLYIFLFERGTMTTSDLGQRKDRAFVEFKRELVSHLTLKRQDKEEVVLQRESNDEESDDEVWQITAPKKLEAGSSEVSEILSSIDFLIVERAVKGKEHMREPRFGLVNPRLDGSFTIRGQTVTFKIGSDAGDDKVYIVTSERPESILVVSNSLYSSLDRGVNDLRSKRIVSERIDEAKNLEITSSNAKVQIERKGLSDWKLLQGKVWILASAAPITELLEAMEKLRAEEFVADSVTGDALEKYGLDKPELLIRASLDGGEKVALSIGGPCPGKESWRYISTGDGGPVACVEDSLLGLVNRSMPRFRELRPAVFKEGNVQDILLIAGKRKLELVKDEAGWRFKEGDTKAEQEAVADLLKKVLEVRAKDIQVGKEAARSLDAPEVEMTLSLLDSQEKLTLRVYPGKEKDTEIVRRGDESALLTIPTGMIRTLSPSPLLYRLRTIETCKASDIEEIEIEGAQNQSLRMIEHRWHVVQPLDVAADSSATRSLADLLAEIKVSRFVAPVAEKTHGLTSPFAVIKARYAEEKKSDGGVDRTKSAEVTLEIGAQAGPGERFARLRGSDATVFVIGADYENAVSRPLVARDLLQIDDTDLVKLVFEVSGVKLSFTRDNDVWSREPAEPFDAKTLSRLITDLSALKTTSALAFGPEGQDFVSPALTITTWTKSEAKAQQKPKKIQIASEVTEGDKTNFIARLEGLDVTFVLPSRLPQDLLKFVKETTSKSK